MAFDKKTGAGMLIGFFLATSILFGYVQLALAPSYSSLLQTKKYAQLSYDITHSAGYSSLQAFVGKINDGAHEVASLPIIGGVVSKSSAPEYTGMVVDLMEGRKELSEQELALINAQISLIQISLPALVFSLLMVIAGSYVLMAGCKESEKKKR